MIRSMTGFGRGTSEVGGVTVWVEISSLNHRYLDVAVRAPSPLGIFENDVRKLVQARVERGRINVSLSSEGILPEANQVEFNQFLARQYVEKARSFATGAGLTDDIGATAILRLNALWTLKFPRPEEMARLWEAVEKALRMALEQLIEMRRSEGENIWADLSARIEQIGGLAKEIAVRAPIVVDEYRQKLKERVVAIVPPGIEIDEQRLLMEVTAFADRADISEELVRMQSHIDQFNSLARQETNVGRRLDFLIQEMFREITTVGSKARDAQTAHSVVEVKGLLEKLREQVQNVE
ncbi:MAG: YicC family protein [Candidatus Lindowbacteria bacterium]|nr:YicC family protein [Candidatus Lindowbacteria bacterium]